MATSRLLTLAALMFLFLFIGIWGCGNNKSVNSNSVYPVKTVNLFYEEEFLDLESDSIRNTTVVPYSWNEWDLYIVYNGTTPVHGIVFQHLGSGRLIAHLVNRTFSSVTAADTSGAPWDSMYVSVPFDSTRVILFKTDTGAIFKLGNSSETANYVDGFTFDYQLLVPGP